MGDVVNFPNLDEEQRRAFEAQIGEFLRQSGYGAEVTAWILSEWERRFRNSYPPTSLPAFDLKFSSENETAALLASSLIQQKDWFHRLVLNLSTQLLLAVTELSAIEFNTPAPDEKTKAQILKLVPRAKDEAPPGKA